MVRKISEIKRILAEYKAELKTHGVRVSKMYLYGSYANGNPKSYSDIDVVVISSDLAKYPALKRQEVLSQWTIPVNAPLEVIGYTPKEFSLAKGTIFGQILNQTAISLN